MTAVNLAQWLPTYCTVVFFFFFRQVLDSRLDPGIPDMNFLFGNRKTPEELLKQNQRALNRAMRELDRERSKLEQQEKKIIADIKKMAKQGQMVRRARSEPLTGSSRANGEESSLGAAYRLLYTTFHIRLSSIPFAPLPALLDEAVVRDVTWDV